MSHLRTARSTLAVACVAAATVLFTPVGDAVARPKKNKRKPAVVSRIEAPLGLQGTRGTGPDVIVPFVLVDRSRRATDVEVQFGFDRNGSSEIEEDEYFPATENKIDAHNTRSNRKGTYSTAGNIGAAQAWVWSSLLDVGASNFPTLAIQYTPQGRVVEDEDNPGQPKFKDVQPGVRVRMRASTGKGARARKGEWVVSDAFAINNNDIPSMTIDGVLPNTTSSPTASDEHIAIKWTVSDPNSEDKNANGVLDILEGEDANLDGLPDFEKVAVAFDYHEVLTGETPSSMTSEQLEALSWLPCTRAAGEGDPDDGVDSSPIGRQYTFVWDSVSDVGTVHKQYVLRARPFDSQEEHGDYAYFKAPFTVDNWKIFNGAGAGDLLGSRTGVTATNLTSGLTRSDLSRPAPFQTFVVAGGADASGVATSDLTVMLVSTESADTSDARPLHLSLAHARAYHSSTMLDDGRVLFAGGVDATGNPTTSTEIYDPFTRLVSAGPDLLVPRSHHAAVRLTSGDVAFFGGKGAAGATLDSVEVYHFSPVGSAVTANSMMPSMNSAQYAAHAVLMPDQRVLVTGGIDASGAAVQTAQLFNPLHDDDLTTPTTKDPQFEAVGNSMLAARKYGSATPLLDGNVLFAGGAGATGAAISSMEVFNYQTNQFEPVDVSMPDGARAQHVAALLGDGSVLLAGGTTDVGLISAPIVTGADVFRLTSRDPGGMWSGQFLPVNGDMRVPRRMAATTTVNNGRVFVLGGLTASGVPTATSEIYTPENGVNGRPTARLVLASSKQSWAFGAPLLYRVTDPERDPGRVVFQWSEDSGTTWHAASPQATTLGGDVAEETADLVSAATDSGSLIDPAQVVGDHTYIWSMKADIERPVQAGLPLPGGGTSDGTKSPFNLRAIPFGAVQGRLSVSTPVTVLFNTKVLATIWPLEDVDGTPNPNQGGDITIYSHLRDVDGNLPGSNGDTASVKYQFAVDVNGDGAILPANNEFWFDMTPAGAPVGASTSWNTNPQTNLFTYYEAPTDSHPAFGERPATEGWTKFVWDSVFDLGAPKAAFDGRVQIRVTPSDLDEGFSSVLRNTSNPVATNFNLVKHPDALYLRSFSPKGGDKTTVKVNEPIDFVFNGLVDPATVSSTTIKVYRNASQVLGAFVTTQNSPVADQTTVTFYPQAQSRNQDESLVYGADDVPNTVLFPFNEYRFNIPGYITGNDPRLGTTLRLDNGGFPTVTSTYLLVQNVTNDGDADASYRFNTTSGHYDDGIDVAIDPTTPQSPAANNVLNRTDGFTLNLTKALDLTTVGSPNLKVEISDSSQVASVVPGYWRVNNTIDPVTGQSRSVLTFVPHFKMPSNGTVHVSSNAGLLGENGRSVTDPTTGSGYIDFNYFVTNYGRQSASYTENFSNKTYEDSSLGGSSVTASWGEDPCTPGSITGLQGGSGSPIGGPDKTVAAGEVLRITQTTTDYHDLTVMKGGIVSIEASSSPTIRLTGNLVVEGLITFAGAPGYSGKTGNKSASTYYLYATVTAGTRRGGTGLNGGGNGGNSVTVSSGRNAGSAGTGNAPGRGGNIVTASTYYSYGTGGGAGGGHGTAGLNGGRATNLSTASSYGPQSVRGSAYGDPNFASGVTPGSGGGGGGSHTYPTIPTMYHEGGAGGAGAGGVTFLIDGVFDLRPTGIIDGSGGHGGARKDLGGAGGGGSGGGLYIIAGVRAVLDGVIDLRGGRGGANTCGYYADYYNYINVYSYGTARFGGDGGLGRCRIEAGNLASVDEVRVFGQLMASKINSVTTSGRPASSSSIPSGWSSTGSLNLGTATDIRYNAGLTIPSNVVVNLQGTTAKRIWVDGDINIQGNLRLNGGEATSVSNTLNSYPTTIESSSSTYYTYMFGYVNLGSSTSAPSVKGFTGVLGGGAGGDPVGGNLNDKHQSTDGLGPSPGKQQSVTNGGYQASSSQKYYMGQAGGGGGGNATPGTEGWAPYAVGGYYTYQGDTNDTTGAGILPQNGGKGGAALDTTILTHTSIANFAGSGGAGGSSGGLVNSRYSWRYFGMAGRGGAGGGAIAFITQGNINVSGRIEARGGRGNPPGAAYQQYYAHSAGGGASGGTVMLIGNNVTLAPGSGEGTSATGATIDLTGGAGGGWRMFRTGTPNQYPSYNTFGQFGGDGGFGRLVVQYANSFNNGQTVLNRWGMQQSTDVFHDGMRQYRALSGSLTYKCYGTPRGGRFRSKWYDLESLNPIVNGLSMTTQRMNLTLTGEGAQSHPRNKGVGLTGEPDPSNTSGFRTIGTGSLVGWRWFRFDGTFTRQSSTGLPPTADDARWSYETDAP